VVKRKGRVASVREKCALFGSIRGNKLLYLRVYHFSLSICIIETPVGEL